MYIHTRARMYRVRIARGDYVCHVRFCKIVANIVEKVARANLGSANDVDSFNLQAKGGGGGQGREREDTSGRENVGEPLSVVRPCMLNSIDVWRFVKVACCSTLFLAPSTVSLPVSLSRTPSLSRTFSLSLSLSLSLSVSLSVSVPPSLFTVVVSQLLASLLRPSVSPYAHTRTRYIPLDV